MKIKDWEYIQYDDNEDVEIYVLSYHEEENNESQPKTNK